MKKIRPFSFIKRLIKPVTAPIQKSIRLQLITTFVFCILLGFLASSATAPLFENMNKKAMIDYSSSMEQMNWRAKYTAETAVEENTIDAINKLIDEEDQLLKNGQNALKVLVTDEAGKVLYKTKQAEEVQINLHDTMSNVMSFAINRPDYTDEKEWSRREFITFYPVTIKGKSLYLFVSGIPEGNVSYETKKGPFPLIIGFFVFIFTYFYMTKRKMKQIEAMAEGVKEMAKGNLAYRIKLKGQDEIASLTGNINHMAEELVMKIEKERKAEKQKNELITNVSHDLRTPLTSIMGYLSLLRDGKYENDQQHKEYIKVAFSKSEQLKNLIDDLFEYTKLTDENFVLHLQEVCINKLLDQLIEELVPHLEERGLSILKNFPAEDVYAVADSEQTVRLFDNLLMNAIKYSIEDSEIQVSLQREQDNLKLSIANHSEEFSKEEMDNLFERFYKKDRSRSRVEGSGLGLSIAKSIAELQGGEIQAEYEDGVVQFHILLPALAQK